tara:strand:+ start:565 stop:780 length:216 start_codon:yes stop_codon:yes gene_type:complete
MWKAVTKIPFINHKARWIGWFVSTHLVLTGAILLVLIALGINPTLMVSVIGAPLWIAVAFASKFITDKITS